MAFLMFTITTPAANAVIGRSVSVTGRARQVGIGLPFYFVEQVAVRVGNGPEQPAQLAGGTWNGVVTVDPSVPGGAPATIVAVARGMVTPDVGEPGDPVPGDPEPFEQLATVVVRL